MNTGTKWVMGILIVALVVVFGALARRGANTLPAGVPIKIGVVGPYTGPQSPYGEGAREGLELAAKELSGERYQGRPVELLFEDSTGDTKSAVSAAQKLISVDNVAVLISVGASAEAVAIAPIAQQAHVPYYTVGSQAAELTDAGEYVFRGMPILAGLGEKLANYAYERGYRRAASLTSSYNQATLDAKKAFNDAFTKLGGTVLASEEVGKDTPDFRTPLARIAALKPDVFFLNVLTADVGPALREKSELGLSMPVISLGSIEDKKAIEVAGKGAEGVVYATYNATIPSEFNDRIKAMFGRDARRWNIEGYEAYKFLTTALGSAKTLDREGIKNAFAGIYAFSGVTAQISFDEKGNAEREVTLKKVINGEFVPLMSEVEPRTWSGPIKVGVIGPMTGGGAVFGNSLLAGIEIARDEQIAKGRTIEVIAEDDATRASAAAAAAHKLAEVDKVQAIITTNSATGNVVSPIAKKAGVIHICSCVDPVVADNVTNFTIAISPREHARVWLAEAKRRNIRTIAILSQEHPGVQSIVAAVKELLPGSGMKVVFEESFNADTTRDFKTMLTKAATFHPDTYYLMSLPPALDIMGQQAHDLGIKNISSSVVVSLTAKPEVFEGTWFTNAPEPKGTLRAKFNAKYPDTRFDNGDTPIGYDALNLLADAFASGGSPASYLAKLQGFAGESGKSTKAAGSGVFESAPALWVVKDGKFVPISN